MRAAGYLIATGMLSGALADHCIRAYRAETTRYETGILQTRLASIERKYRPMWFFDAINFNQMFPGVTAGSDGSAGTFAVKYDPYTKNIDRFNVSRLGNPNMKTVHIYDKLMEADIITIIPENTPVCHDEGYAVIATSPDEFRVQTRRLHGVNYPFLTCTALALTYFTVKLIKVVA